jgi:hypothetical protein
MDRGSDARIGMDASITRRDFVNGALAGAGAVLLGAAAPAVAQGLGPAFDGYGGVGDYAGSNGNTAAVVNAAHAALRDGRDEAGLREATLVDDTFDVVVVGGGLSGLAAAYHVHRARPTARVLILENHPVPGGEAKQNEIVVDGVRLIGPQASNDTDVPSHGLPAELWDALQLPKDVAFVEPTGAARGLRFARDNFEPWYWGEGLADIGWFFDGTAFGATKGWALQNSAVARLEVSSAFAQRRDLRAQVLQLTLHSDVASCLLLSPKVLRRRHGAESGTQRRILGVQRFDCRQRNPVLVDRRDVLVVLADFERSIEVLGHRADVADAVLGLVAPATDRQRRHLVKDGRVIERNDVCLGVAVAQRGPRSRARCELRADGAGRIRVEREPARRPRQELVCA